MATSSPLYIPLYTVANPPAHPPQHFPEFHIRETTVWPSTELRTVPNGRLVLHQLTKVYLVSVQIHHSQVGCGCIESHRRERSVHRNCNALRSIAVK